MYPFLSLDTIDLDPELAQRLPRRLAYYHLALPIAQDGKSITVAMAHPENQNVVSVLENALGATVIPVRSFAETIRQQLDRVWQLQHGSALLRVAYWARTADALNQSAGYVEALLAGREAQIERCVTEDAAALPAADLVIAADGNAPESLFRTPASVLVLDQPDQLPRTILHVLRGHIPDYRALDWLVSLAQGAEITLLLSVDGEARKPLVSDLSSILLAQDKRQAHVAQCRQMLSEAGITGRLKLRQDSLLAAVQSEVSDHAYDLVATAAEAYGDVAYQISERVRGRCPAFLVIKP